MFISASVPSLYLDPQIRDWVLFPITLVMVVEFVLCRCARTHSPGLSLDISRGVEALRCRSFTVISDKAPTGSYPRTVRTRI